MINELIHDPIFPAGKSEIGEEEESYGNLK